MPRTNAPLRGRLVPANWCVFLLQFKYMLDLLVLGVEAPSREKLGAHDPRLRALRGTQSRQNLLQDHFSTNGLGFAGLVWVRRVEHSRYGEETWQRQHSSISIIGFKLAGSLVKLYLPGICDKQIQDDSDLDFQGKDAHSAGPSLN